MHNRVVLLFRCIIFFCAVFTCSFIKAQVPAEVRDSLYKIAGSQTISRHFATLYFNFGREADTFTAGQDAAAARFITAFEKNFAAYFFNAVQTAQEPAAQTFSWQRYYSRLDLNAFQYYFTGMNAHINGDMWQALVTAHSYDSIKKYRQALISFQRPLNIIFDSAYTACRKYKKINQFHNLTLGLGKWYGKKMILHWRKKQIQLALLYYTNSAMFSRRLHKTYRKMKRLDAVVLKHFS